MTASGFNHLEPSRTSMTKLIYENSSGLKAVKYFRKKNPSAMFGWMVNIPLIF